MCKFSSSTELRLSSASTLHTDRFNLYAPFVKSLEVYDTSAEHYETRSWNCLLALSSQQTLLPNLVSLTLTTDCDDCCWDLVFWVRIFASRSLTRVASIPVLPRDPPEISHLAVSMTLKWLVEHSPHLQSLSLFPSKEFYDGIGEYRFFSLIDEAPFHYYLLPTLEVRELSCSMIVLEGESLQALDRLPQLERLTVYTTSDVLDYEPKAIAFPGNLFPSLQCLYLHLPDCWDLFWVLDVHVLLANITTLEVNIVKAEQSSLNLTSREFFPLLADIPRLEHLSLELQPECLGEPIPLGHSAILYKTLYRLPLQTVFISPVIFKHEDLSGTLGSIWPHVTHLQLPGSIVSLRDLPMFARLPSLEHLTIRLNLSAKMQKNGGFQTPVSPRLHTLEASSGSIILCEKTEVKQVAQFLLSLWPNLRQVVWPRNSEKYELDFVEALNEGLGMLRRKLEVS
ncbi:hypothetical protein FS749_000118 [Ceratobasidium sp. UAMH 11750]|nr:hypothetical protein FS749_000118 [Ceratobasidium sp. UAMH 11750]